MENIDALDWLAQLTTHLPNWGEQMCRYYGFYSNTRGMGKKAGADDVIPDRFFEEPLTVGDKKGAVLTRNQFKTMMDEFYTQRGWDLKISKPGAVKLKSLELAA